jgi:Domain of unknown function (DUF222)
MYGMMVSMLGEGGTAPSPGLAKLFAALADYQPGPDCRQELTHLALARHRLDLLMSGLAAELTDSGAWDEDGYTTPIQWLREEAKLPTGVACQHVSVGLSLGSVPRSVEALERGEIGFGHLALMADTACFYRQGTFDEAAFLEKAREQNVSKFRRTCEHARHAQDPSGFAETERERHEYRFLKLSPQEDGALMFRGWLDPEGGSLLRSALEPLARRSGVGDDRTRDQRLADALVEATTRDHQTELVVTCTLETLEGRAGSPAAETEWGGLLSGETVERLVCGGASLRRLVLDGDGVVIDFGRRRRLLSPQARRALEARDKHCVWPGCDRPPRWCDSHHQRDWRLQAPTSVEESALLCGRHHKLRHDGGWQLFRTRAGRWEAISPLPPRWSSHPDLPAG